MIITTYDGSLKFDTKIDTNGFSKGANTIKSQSNALKGTLLSLGKAMSIAFGITAMVAFSKQAIDTASDLKEVQNVVDTAFKDMSYKIEEFADSSIENFGLSELASKQMASTYMAMSTGMGQMAGVASDMAVEITGRLGDVMSFYNKTASEADTIGKAIYTGETEPLKAIGVVMTQTNLSAYALSKGMSKTYDTMSSGEQLLVRQQFFLEQTSLAAGDFVKTSGSWANQTRVLSERWKEFLGIIGNGLIQVLTPVIQILNSAMSYMITFANTASKVLASVFGLSNATAGTANNTAAIATNTQDASAGLSDMGDAAKKASKEISGTAGFDKLNNTTEGIADNASNAAGSLSGIETGSGLSFNPTVGPADTSALENSLSGIGERIKTLLQPASDALDRLKLAVTPFAENVGSGLKWFFDNVLVPFGAWTVSELVPAFLDTLGAAIKALNVIIEALKPLALWLFDTFLEPIAIWTGGVIVSSLEGITSALTILSTWVTNNQSTIEGMTIAAAAFIAVWEVTKLLAFIQMSGGLVAAFLAITTSIWACTGAKIVDKAETVILTAMYAKDFVMSLVSGTAALIKQAAQWVINTALKIADTAATIAMTVATTAWNVICLVATTVTTAFGAAVAFLTSPIGLVVLAIGALIAIGVLLYQNWDTVKAWAKTAWEAIKTTVSTAINIVIGFFGKVIEWAKKNWQGLLLLLVNPFAGAFKLLYDNCNVFKKFIDKFVAKIGAFFSGLWSGITSGINELKNTFTTVFNSLVDIVKKPVNMIIDIMNGMIGGIVGGVNSVIKAIDSINFTLPDWVPGIGGKGIGFNIPTFTAPKIPKLATGTVVPKNYGEFLSILGDNTREAEVVSPISTMKQAFKEAMSELGQSGSGNMAHFTFILGNKVLFDGVVAADKEYRAQTGKSAFQN